MAEASVHAGGRARVEERSRGERSRAVDLSVVIPSVNGWRHLEGCLAALAAQSGDAAVEVIVADRVGPEVRRPLRARYPEARLLEAPSDASIPALRAAAFAACRGPVVGVLEDHVIVPPDWAARMLDAHRNGALVVGGSVENGAGERLSDWAAFFCEYSHCLEISRTDSALWVTGNNVTYRRSLLREFEDVIGEERWEDRLHQALREAGVPLASRPEIRVSHRMGYTVSGYLGQRYLYARSYAGTRAEGAGALGRAAWALKALALPPVLLARTLSRVWRTGRHRRELLGSVPLLALFVVAWAAGEAVGALAGPGDSLRRVR